MNGHFGKDQAPPAGMSTSSRDRKWWDLQRVFPFAFWKSNEEVDNCPEEEDAVAEECRERELTPTKYRKPPVPDIRFSFLEGEEPKRQEDEDEESESYASTLDTAGVPHEESEEEQGATNAALMSTLTLTFSVKEENLYEIVAERPQLGEATATYSSPREAAVASLAPVYSSVDKQKRSPLPPPLPSPDWDPEPVDVPGQGALTPAVWKKRTRLDKAWTTVKKWWNNGAVLQPPQSTPTSPVASTLALWPLHQGQSGFEDLRRYIKQGGDVCKELASILQERSEAETQYAKTLAKLSSKLIKATRESNLTVNNAWQRIGVEMEHQSEVHRTFASCLSEEVVKPLRQLLESQHRIRKSVENAVDKSGKSLAEWRNAENKAKKYSFSCARENEKLRDLSHTDHVRNRLSASSLHLHRQSLQPASEKETAKLESKRRKAEECVKKADIEYYSVCMRAERARLDWEAAVNRGSHCFQVLEEERLRGMKDLANSYLNGFNLVGPKLTEIANQISEPVGECNPIRDLETVEALKAATQPPQEQLLPDFYAEHLTLAMNRERRKQALVKLLQLIRQDLERERRGKNGVENLARALKQAPNFATHDTQHNVSEKLHHMRSMLAYLEATRYKISMALAEVEGRPKESHPLAEHIQVTRDRQGYQHTTLKVPSWVHKELMDVEDYVDWVERGTADGNSVQPDSDFDEFSSQGSEKEYEEASVIRLSDSKQLPAPSTIVNSSDHHQEPEGETIQLPSQQPHSPLSLSKCKALYNYTANLYDELSLNPGDIISIHDKQPDGWWLGELNGVVGIFPATYVEEIK